MNNAIHSKFARATLTIAMLLIASVANAQQGGSAKGTLTLQGSDGPLSVTFAHAYYITGPGSFDNTQKERRIVFTAEDHAAAITECAAYRCAQLALIDGLTFFLADQDMANWWAHVGQTQMSGTAIGDKHFDGKPFPLADRKRKLHVQSLRMLRDVTVKGGYQLGYSAVLLIEPRDGIGWVEGGPIVLTSSGSHWNRAASNAVSSPVTK